ncbi:MAG: NYN domain-containing protein [Clostridia bacterium]|nr:NYN domain-containing protein [Clostridia bacterium]
MKKLVFGILAHVDAGKTTLSEGLLYTAGVIDKLGRVDKQSAYMDTHELERERGITIFSKQATFEFLDTHASLIDTPGHVDFVAEAERALAVQDYAILVVSATESVEAHTKTLWQLISSRGIPAFVFINKTDICRKTRAEIMEALSTHLGAGFVDFTHTNTEFFFEDAAGRDEELMEEFFSTGTLTDASLRGAIKRRKIFPCFFGSALKMNGVSEFLTALDRYTEERRYNDRLFGGKVYKIERDKKGRRLAFMKITGGRLAAKDILRIPDGLGGYAEEKVEEIRIYTGDRYKSVSSATAGEVCAILGADSLKAGMGIGIEAEDRIASSPVFSYRIRLADGVNPYEAFSRLRPLGEEDPSLSLSYNAESEEITVALMGEIQTEVLLRVIKDRFGLDVSFDEGKILYRETIAETVVGRGHFEPLRHYAEVHLRLEPLPEGSGIVVDTECDTDRLQSHWQRLILTHIEERRHRGVLTGSPLTDVKITLTQGRAHLKHTEGGDFRQATYRAIRQGLRKAESLLLEPTFDFRLELPKDNLGRAMNDLAAMGGTSELLSLDETTAVLIGTCPVATMRKYPREVRAYTGGEGRITLTKGAYIPCHNTDEVMAEIAYDPDRDERNTADSVFCKEGSGYVVPWYESDEKMHIKPEAEAVFSEDTPTPVLKKRSYASGVEEDKELMRIFEATYGKVKPRKVAERRENAAKDYTGKQERRKKPEPKKPELIIIDGYNLIFAWDELRGLSERDVGLARDALIRLMCSHTAFKRCKCIIVFDAYRRKENTGAVEEIGSVTVVYTKEGQTADAYIEKTTHERSSDSFVRVVSSDMQEQLMILGSGGFRVSAREFRRECECTVSEIKEAIEGYGS